MAAELNSWKMRITRTEDPPRNSLNFFTNRLKVVKEKRDTSSFKGNFRPKNLGRLMQSRARFDGPDRAAIMVHHLEQSWLPILR